MHDYQTKGCSRYGASMGRRSDIENDTTAKLSIRKVPLDQGGYDPGGAYWGTPNDLYMVSDEDGGVAYLRAASFDAAKAKFPRATWAFAAWSEDDIADMVQGYAECALWSSTTDDPDFEGEPENNPGGYPLDAEHNTSDIAPETMKGMLADCLRFVQFNAWTLAAIATETEIDWSRLGHDFWLSRNGHGAGFGDGDWPDPWDDMLHDACGWRTSFGEVNLYVGDDGKIYSD